MHVTQPYVKWKRFTTRAWQRLAIYPSSNVVEQLPCPQIVLGGSYAALNKTRGVSTGAIWAMVYLRATHCQWRRYR